MESGGRGALGNPFRCGLTNELTYSYGPAARFWCAGPWFYLPLLLEGDFRTTKTLAFQTKIVKSVR